MRLPPRERAIGPRARRLVERAASATDHHANDGNAADSASWSTTRPSPPAPSAARSRDGLVERDRACARKSSSATHERGPLPGCIADDRASRTSRAPCASRPGQTRQDCRAGSATVGAAPRLSQPSAARSRDWPASAALALFLASRRTGADCAIRPRSASRRASAPFRSGPKRFSPP